MLNSLIRWHKQPLFDTDADSDPDPDAMRTVFDSHKNNVTHFCKAQ